jgi:hypothetical protein
MGGNASLDPQANQLLFSTATLFYSNLLYQRVSHLEGTPPHTAKVQSGPYRYCSQDAAVKVETILPVLTRSCMLKYLELLPLC